MSGSQLMDFIYAEKCKFENSGKTARTVHLTNSEYDALVEEARECVGRLYYGRRDRTGPEQIYEMDIVSSAETFAISDTTQALERPRNESGERLRNGLPVAPR